MIWGSRETEEYLVLLANKVLKDLKVQRELKDHLVKLELLDLQGKKAKKDHLDLLVTLVDLVTRETKDLKGETEHLEAKEKEEKMAFREKEVRLAQEALEEEWEDQEVLE